MTTVIDQIIIRALKEDSYQNDITSKILIDSKHISIGHIVAKEAGVLCGIGIAKKVFYKVNPNIRFQMKFKDGQRFKKNDIICTFKGKTRSLLAGERTALNFLGYLSGITSATHNYVLKVKGTKAVILDTRKTVPNLRVLDKYAVKCAGGENHRFDLSEMVLIKDNHLLSASKQLSFEEIIRLMKRKTKRRIQVEVDTIKQYKEAVFGLPDMILLDNMNTRQLKEVVRFNNALQKNKRPLLEASGGVNLNNVRSVAQTGVDRISIGALTHTHKNINFSMELSD